jgi:hypothetical protein
MRTFFSVRVLRGLDDGNRARSPQIVALALNTLCVQLIILGMELERHIVLLLVGHHQIQILATSAPHEGGFAGIERQYIHTAIFMDEGPRGLVASRSLQTLETTLKSADEAKFETNHRPKDRLNAQRASGKSGFGQRVIHLHIFLTPQQANADKTLHYLISVHHHLQVSF